MVTPAGNGRNRPIDLGVVKYEPWKTKHTRRIRRLDTKKLNLFVTITRNYMSEG